jgi:hypothetical protein
MQAILPLVRGVVWDVALDISVPVISYYLAKRLLSASDFAALAVASLFPLIKSLWDLRRRREIDPVAVLILLGVACSAVALLFSGDQRMLLIRESFVTGAFGVACLVSLVFPRPMMFYFARYFMAGRDAERRRLFESRWQYSAARRAHRFVTTVWGLVFVGEFISRVLLAYTLRPTVVLSVAPIATGFATIGTIVWTFRYAARVRDRLPA